MSEWAKEMDTFGHHVSRLTSTVQKGLYKWPNNLDGLQKYIENYIEKYPTDRHWRIDVSNFDTQLVNSYVTMFKMLPIHNHVQNTPVTGWTVFISIIAGFSFLEITRSSIVSH